jgi:hypothetical protein
MPQTSLSNYVQALDQAGLLTRYMDEKRVDELPTLMEQHPGRFRRASQGFSQNAGPFGR